MKQKIAAILLFVFIINSAFATTLKEYQEKLNKYEQNKNKTKKKIEEIKTQKVEISNQINQIDKNIYTLSQNINKTQNDIYIYENKINEVNIKLNKSINLKNEHYQKLKNRIQAIYEASNVTYLEVLLESNDIGDFFSRLAYIKDIMEYDRRILTDYLNTIKDIEQNKKALISLKSNLETKKNEFISQKQVLEQKQNSKKELLDKLEKQQDELEKVLDELERISNEISKKIKEIISQQKKKRKYIGGKLLWPLLNEYPITSYFGNRFHPILKKYKMHTGIDIGAPYGANVLAASDGEIIYAGWISGYGQAIIIDHGSNITTLYAHLSNISVRVGQIVKKGEKIGNVGSTGYSTGPHLHFEVRINGDVTDPLQYLR
ncbi:murein hydrolase activator EnvC [Caldicellulosiruptoraceae bacterium PP1]